MKQFYNLALIPSPQKITSKLSNLANDSIFKPRYVKNIYNNISQLKFMQLQYCFIV